MTERNPLIDTSEQEDEDKKAGRSLGTKRKFEEFDCPTCSANNPFDTFGNGDELLCGWCGLQFKAIVDDEGTLKLKEL